MVKLKKAKNVKGQVKLTYPRVLVLNPRWPKQNQRSPKLKAPGPQRQQRRGPRSAKARASDLLLQAQIPEVARPKFAFQEVFNHGEIPQVVEMKGRAYPNVSVEKLGTGMMLATANELGRFLDASGIPKFLGLDEHDEKHYLEILSSVAARENVYAGMRDDIVNRGAMAKSEMMHHTPDNQERLREWQRLDNQIREDIENIEEQEPERLPIKQAEVDHGILIVRKYCKPCERMNTRSMPTAAFLSELDAGESELDFGDSEDEDSYDHPKGSCADKLGIAAVEKGCKPCQFLVAMELQLQQYANTNLTWGEMTVSWEDQKEEGVGVEAAGYDARQDIPMTGM